MTLKNFALKISLIFISFYSFATYANEITLISEEFPSETDNIKNTDMGGIAGETVTLALKAKNISYVIRWMPWKNAQVEVLKNNDKKSFILPLTRNSERENKYNWISKVYDDEIVFFTLKSNKKINSFKEANGHDIGVLTGSSHEISLRDPKNGIDKSNILNANSQATNIKKLLEGKIYAYYINIIGGISTIKSLNVKPDLIEFGDKIESEQNYIATSKSTPTALADKIKSAIEDFKKTPKYAEILKKYMGK